MMASEQNRTLEAVTTAIQMEIDGKAFYLRAAKASGNALGSKLFSTLAKEEDNHRLKFKAIFEAIQAKKNWPAVDLEPVAENELKTVFSQAPEQLELKSSELEDVQIAMGMENKTRDFYKAQAAKATFKAEKDYYEVLSKEETLHHKALFDYSEYLKNPADYFTMKERHSLDGG
jgi:rubrerythrin